MTTDQLADLPEDASPHLRLGMSIAQSVMHHPDEPWGALNAALVYRLDVEGGAVARRFSLSRARIDRRLPLHEGLDNLDLGALPGTSRGETVGAFVLAEIPGPPDSHGESTAQRFVLGALADGWRIEVVATPPTYATACRIYAPSEPWPGHEPSMHALKSLLDRMRAGGTDEPGNTDKEHR